MKNLIILWCCLTTVLSFGQMKYEGPALAALAKGFADARVSEDCAGLRVKVLSQNATLPLKKVEIFIKGGDNRYPYTTNKSGETFIISSETKLDLEIKADKIKYIGGTCSNVELEKGKTRELTIYLNQDHATIPEPEYNKPQPVKKPVIYLYPEKEMALDITLEAQGAITFSYPAYKNGWNALVKPNGDIEIGGRTYPYLFWEGKLAASKQLKDFKTGFVVAKADVVSFLEEKLSYMGLNAREMTDFITFWAPQLEQQEYSFIHFVCAEDYAHQIAELKLSTKPDSEIRINMFYTSVNADFKIATQTLQRFERKGFTVVEWGGGEIQGDY